MENEKDMWINHSQNNIDKLVKDVNNANSYNSFKNSQSNIGNMRRFTPTILKNNKNY
jgi:hypothetical protein